MNPFLYAFSLEEKEKEIHKIVGQEASGGQYNVIRLDQGLVTNKNHSNSD